jgi:hypothetical protein
MGFWGGALLVLVASCAESTGPHLASATPAQANRGAIVAIAGERLCAGDCAIAAGMFDVGNARAAVMTLTDTTAQITIPDVAPVGKTAIVLTVNGSSSNALAFEVLP